MVLKLRYDTREISINKFILSVLERAVEFMNFKRVIAALCTAFMIVASVAVSADETKSSKKIELVFEDVTASDTSTMTGEAKIKVSIKGAEGNVAIAQLGLMFSGDLKYSSIDMLINDNNPDSGSTIVYPNAAEANALKTLNMGLISAKTPMKFSAEQPICILTFSGEAGKSVTVTPNTDLTKTYCRENLDSGDDIELKDASATCSATASATEVKAIQANIKVVMDKVEGFLAKAESDGYQTSGVMVKITSEKRPSNVFYTYLNNVTISNGGNRDGDTSVPTFIITQNVLAGDTYTVEVSTLGYIPYKATGVKFDKTVEITNSELIPGDVNNDGVVNAEDKKFVTAAIENGEYKEEADFNRDGRIDESDLAVFKDIKGDVPEKMSAPSATSTQNSVTLKWTKPSDESVSGYTIRYGTDKNKLGNDTKINNANTVEYTFSNLSANSTYYFEIAAVNGEGTGVYSDTIDIKTKTESKSDNTGGGGTGGGGGGTGGGGIGGSTGSNTNTGNTGTNGEPTTDDGKNFTDLSGYDWAEDAIYALKAKGIISGISETEFAPANNIKRGDFILMLTRMLNIDTPFTENFADVPSDSYYYDAIGKAKAAGIAQGSGENFMPEQTITRQDLITLAYRAFLNKGYITEVSDLSVLDVFGDKGDISDYANAPMASMVASGIIKGSGGKVNPLGNATRAETAVMCNRLVDLMK